MHGLLRSVHGLLRSVAAEQEDRQEDRMTDRMTLLVSIGIEEGVSLFDVLIVYCNILTI